MGEDLREELRQRVEDLKNEVNQRFYGVLRALQAVKDTHHSILEIEICDDLTHLVEDLNEGVNQAHDLVLELQEL